MKVEAEASVSASSSADSTAWPRVQAPTDHGHNLTVEQLEAREGSRQPRNKNPLFLWLQTQIREFSLPLLILAIKSLSVFIILTCRGSIPAVLFLSIYQATSVANHFGPQTFIVSIVAALTFAFLPRAKFLQLMFWNLLLSCLVASISLLGIWCARQARFHTQNSDDLDPYNPSAAAISAVFLFLNLFAVNSFRAVLTSIL